MNERIDLSPAGRARLRELKTARDATPHHTPDGMACPRCTYTAAAVESLPAALNLIDRLEAIVDRLPKTADGVPITDGTVTWCASERPFPHRWEMRLKNGQTLHEHGERQYSTRQAARAAKEVSDG